MSPRAHIPILRQPDDNTCGPTCLQAVYAHYGDHVDLSQVIAEVTPLESGGTLAVYLARHALQRKYRATIHTYNLQLFDPTWFTQPRRDLASALMAQQQAKPDARLHLASEAYLGFLALGGEIEHYELKADLLADLLTDDNPILTGLSATYLYGCARECNEEYDDINGVPTGHFVVLSDFDRTTGTIDVADPLHDNPRFESSHYRVGVERLIGAILLGVVTYDANLLIIRPK